MRTTAKCKCNHIIFTIFINHETKNIINTVNIIFNQFDLYVNTLFSNSDKIQSKYSLTPWKFSKSAVGILFSHIENTASLSITSYNPCKIASSIQFPLARPFVDKTVFIPPLYTQVFHQSADNYMHNTQTLLEP